MAKSKATQQLEQLLKNNVNSQLPPLTAEELDDVCSPCMHKESVALLAIAYINKLLATAANRRKGLALLNSVLDQCPSSLVLENAIAWSSLCVAPSLKSGGDIKFNVLGAIMEICGGIQDFDKAMIGLLPKVIDVCLTSTCENGSSQSVLECLTICMVTYPSSTGPFRNKIESYLCKYLTCELPLSTVKRAGSAFHFLQQVGGHGPGGIINSTNWSTQLSKLCSTMHKLYDRFFANIIEFESYDDECTAPFEIPHLSLVNSSNKGGSSMSNSNALISVTLRNIVVFIKQMLTNRYPVAKNVPIAHILDVIKRGLSVDVFKEFDESLEMTRFAALLYRHQLELLMLLRSIMACLNQELMRFSFTVTKMLTDCLQRTQKDYFKSDCKYQKAVYDALRYWIVISRNKLNNSNLHSKLLEHIVADVTPAKTNVTLCLSDSVSKNKSPKARNRAIQQKIMAKSNESSAREPLKLLKAREVVCMEALNVGSTLLQHTILDLDHDMYQKLFEKIAQHIISIQGGRILHPYTNSACQSGLYQMLTSIFVQPDYCITPMVQMGIRLIVKGHASTDNNIHLICAQGLHVLEKLCQPVCPSLGLGEIFCNTYYKYKKPESATKEKLNVSDSISNNHLGLENHHNTTDHTITSQVSAPSASSKKKVNIIDVHILKQGNESTDVSNSSLAVAEVQQNPVSEDVEIADEEVEAVLNEVTASELDDEFVEEGFIQASGPLRNIVSNCSNTDKHKSLPVSNCSNTDKHKSLPAEEIEPPIKRSKSMEDDEDDEEERMLSSLKDIPNVY